MYYRLADCHSADMMLVSPVHRQHVNRSVRDVMTGSRRKQHKHLLYPLRRMRFH